MAVLRDIPYGNARFEVEIDTIARPGIVVAQLPDLIAEQVDYREGSDALRATTPVVKRPRFGSLILKRGFNGSLDFYQWWRGAADGTDGARRRVAIKLLNDDRSAIVATWQITGALPVRYGFSPLDGEDGGVLVEVIEVACQNVVMA